MILAAGLSPAWQQIVVLERLKVGEVNRAAAVHWCASGKVLNVALALKSLSTTPGEIEVQALSTAGGSIGGAIRRQFSGMDVPARWIETESPTRVCTTILDHETHSTTELVENARAVSADELVQFRSAYREESARAEVVVLTGSLPAGVPATFYRDLLAATPGRAVLDAQQEPLLAALEARPFVVKPNREELGNTLRQPLKTDDQLHSAMRELCCRGATWAVVSDGEERVWIGSQHMICSARPLEVPVVNPIGSGDCLAAGIALALARDEDLPAAVLYGMAAAADNVGQLLPARLDPQRVAGLREKIRIESGHE